jgi:asparagine synthase (glutamine-hydrolysing)
MCGICGKLEFGASPRPIHPELVKTMIRTMNHRGPDEEGLYISGNVALAHKRLCIIDLSSGAQPMGNEDNTVQVVFNGEIYNYKELRAFLVSQGHRFRTSSDTEVIVHLYEELGEECVRRLHGMFSFALWDGRNQALLLARDRTGIKPLYYHLTETSLSFASEIKAILADPSVSAEMDPAALDLFLKFHYTPGESTLFRQIRKLSPGHYLTVRRNAVKVTQYWDLRFSGERNHQSDEDAARELDGLLLQTVSDHMISDVPVGVLLSGGIDSTAVLSYATEAAGGPLSTFTIGFGEQLCPDERVGAQIAARQFGSKHYEATFTAQDFAACLPTYVWHMEEPVVEPPAIALYYITKLAREHVTVLLSGEGGDEAFAGYNTYRNIVWLERIKSALGPTAAASSVVLGALGKITRSPRLAWYARLLNIPLEQYYYSRAAGPLDFFNQNRDALLTDRMMAQMNLDRGENRRDIFAGTEGLEILQKLLYVDTKTWLPDDLLIKADKITMANSVELRVPFLDHKVLEFAASLPGSKKLRGTQTKYILKRAVAGRIPKELLSRPKTGFPVPYKAWLEKDLKNFARDILTDRRTLQRGYFEQRTVERLLSGNSRGQDYSKEIFSLIVFELWNRIFLDDRKNFMGTPGPPAPCTPVSVPA